MHCASCEKLLVSEFKNVPGVVDVEISQSRGEAEIYFEVEVPNFGEFKKIAQKFGYDASEEKMGGERKARFKMRDWLLGGFFAGVVLIIFALIQKLNLVPNIGIGQKTMDVGVAFLIGITASFSSCLAVVGAVVISFAEKYKTNGDNFYQNAVRPNLFFQAGRLMTFFTLGGVLGFVGGELSLNENFVAIFTIFVAFIMIWLGLNILGLLPSIANLGVHLPSGLTRRWDRLKASNHKFAPFLLGGLSFFLPCGFTQSMQIFALASGSFLDGALAMLIFALGTLPVLLVVGITASSTKQSRYSAFKVTAGILVIIFAIYTFNSGRALANFQSSHNSQIENNDSDFQEVRMSITRRGFEPSVINLEKGVPVRWIINGDGATGCTNKIIIPSLGISQDIHSGDNVVKFQADEAGQVPFSCWMGMVRGRFIVQ